MCAPALENCETGSPSSILRSFIMFSMKRVNPHRTQTHRHHRPLCGKAASSEVDADAYLMVHVPVAGSGFLEDPEGTKTRPQNPENPSAWRKSKKQRALFAVEELASEWHSYSKTGPRVPRGLWKAMSFPARPATRQLSVLPLK